MDLLLKHSIPGLEHDSSDRNDPPQCHPGTRLEICAQARDWFHNLSREERVLWLHGPAGVGKSAIMQTLADDEGESPNSILGSTIFISRPKRLNDSLRFFTTIAFRLAVRFPAYLQYVVNILTRDPQIVTKKVAEQFKWFIVKPFAEEKVLEGLRDTVLIIIDGLDECDGTKAQRELISLIGSFAVKHPDSPLIWAIASRPEPQIKDEFSLLRCDPPLFWEIDVRVDSKQARIDVERFLRAKFDEVVQRYPSSFSSPGTRWPAETDFLKVATAASGHFGFAVVVMNFILDEEYGNPVSQLKTVLNVIAKTPLLETETNPLALLDSLYNEVLSAVPPNVLPTTMSILAWSFGKHFRFVDTVRPVLPPLVICNWWGIGQADFYGALQKLHSVLYIPSAAKVVECGDDMEFEFLEPCHASFSDYLTSHVRSGDFHVTNVFERILRSSLRVLRESYSPRKWFFILFCFRFTHK
jgi:hypothetical protein